MTFKVTPARKTKGRTRKQYSSPALEKGLDILETLSHETEGLNISQLAKAHGRSVGQIFRMVAVLEQRGYIELREGTDNYVLTLKMFELSHRFPPVARLTSAAMPVMKRLAYESKQSCHIVTYYQGRGHVVAQQDAPTARIFTVRLGAEAPLLDTCSGHVLLAFADAERRESMLGQIPKHHRQPKRGELKKLTDRIQKAGCETIKSGQVHGVEDIGFPILDRSEECVGALVIPYIGFLDGSNALSKKEAVDHARSAAEEISKSLGRV